jgi:hypothetical protein
MSSNKVDSSDKANHRTHHTRFFEKLYGNLEKSSDAKDEEKDKSYGFSLNLPNDVARQQNLNSPSESSGSSTEMFASEMSSSRCGTLILIDIESKVH